MRKQFVLFIGMIVVVFLLAVFHPFMWKVDAKSEEVHDVHYEIYPQPQAIEYGEEALSLDEDFEVIYDDTIDDVTKEKLKTIFDDHGLAEPEVVEVPSGDNVTILVGTADADGTASKLASMDEDMDYEQADAYELRIENDMITVIGKDTDASFYGLVSLDRILEQSKNGRVRNVHIKDFASSSVRGFIEGFYGVPWSNEDRMELMRFGGEHKMNAYIFAPKNDPYHNEKWREAYPDEEIAEIAERAEVGKESNTQFVWMIHPFMIDPVRFDEHYDADLQAIITKFEQLYDAGVRQFGVLADDIDLDDESAQNQLQLMRDLHEWNGSKKGTYDLMFTPSIYNYEWVSGNEQYFDVINELPTDVHVMWTGEEVMGSVEQITVEHFQQLMSRNESDEIRGPLFWLNWPVNDNNPVRLTIGKSEVMDVGVSDLDGIITNPMQQAEASKGALFTIADYAWNTDQFDVDRNWEDSFAYIEGHVPGSLRELAKHLNDQSPNMQGTVYEESEDMKDLLNNYVTFLDDGAVTTEQTNELLEDYQVIVDAVVDVKENAENRSYVNEVEPWINSLRDVAEATIFYLKAQKLYMKDEVEQAKVAFEKGQKRQKASENHFVQNLDGEHAVEAGAKRLVPFMEHMEGKHSRSLTDLTIPTIVVGVSLFLTIGGIGIYFVRRRVDK